MSGLARSRSVIPSRHRGGGKSKRRKAAAITAAKRAAAKADRRNGRASIVEHLA
jgi:hypothetical protein